MVHLKNDLILLCGVFYFCQFFFFLVFSPLALLMLLKVTVRMVIMR